MSATVPSVVVDGVTHRYGGTAALEAMSWTAGAGEITCVLGPNGAGKTTVMEMAEGLRRPQSGTVRVLGADPWNADAAHRQRVGVMLQDGGLPGSVKPLRLLEHLARLYGGTGQLPDLVRDLGIEQFRRTSIRRLSGGQRQRVALAAALVGAPEVAFLDEPSAGLDPHARLEVWDLVGRVRDRGCCVVLTTHSFDEAARIADRVIIVAGGAVAAAGTVAEVGGAAGLEDAYFSLTRSGEAGEVRR